MCGPGDPPDRTSIYNCQISTWFSAVSDLLIPSVDRLEQLPDRAGLIFNYDAKAALACSMKSGRFSASSFAGTRMLTSGRVLLA